METIMIFFSISYFRFTKHKNDKNDILKNEIGSANLKKYIKRFW